MNRRLWLCSVIGLLATGMGARAAESLRIVPIVSNDQVLVSFELADAFTDEVREAISSGLRTTFTYEIELRMVVPLWVDPKICTAVVSAVDQYDNLTRRHSLARTVDGRVEEDAVVEDESETGLVYLARREGWELSEQLAVVVRAFGVDSG